MKIKHLITTTILASQTITMPVVKTAAIAAIPAAVALLSASPAHAAEEIDANNLLSMSLAELSEIEITSVSKRKEAQSEAAAAVYTITSEDIKNSGATAIPELLRVVPGITVTRAASGSWTVTARGFNGQFSNKLLVLMDGRTLYSPLFSGVIWDVQDTVLEDIDRIEVIRGPGATLWGANAVNGVINIITKETSQTQGGLAVAQVGNQVKGIGTLRYGGKIGDESYMRAYVKHKAYDHEHLATGGSANDDWGRTQFGFRTDSQLTEKDKLNIQGDYYKNREDVRFTIPDLTAGPTFTSAANDIDAKGYNVMTTWEHKNSEESVATLQAYVDYTDYKTTFFNDQELTLDFDAQHYWSGWDGHNIVYGVGYRLIKSENNPTAQFALTPNQRRDNLFSAFAQDEITLIEDEVFLTLGSKIEHNDYTGVEIQPSARISWLFDSEGWGDDDTQAEHTLWASVSRAVHTPYRYTSDARQAVDIAVLPGPTPVYVNSVSNRNLNSEQLIAYEIGYRIKPEDNISFDLATFYNEYDHLFFTSVGTPTAFIPVVGDNSGASNSLGAELSVKWNVTEDWHLAGSYSYLREKFNKKNSVSLNYVGTSPRHQFNVRSNYMITDSLELNNALYYVDDLHGLGINDYFRFDTMLSYELSEGAKLTLVGQNLLDPKHQEYTPFQYRNASEIGRSVYAGLSLAF